MTKRQSGHISVLIGDLDSLLRHYNVIFQSKYLKFCTSTCHKVVFAHTKSDLVQIKGSGFKRRADSAPPLWPVRVFEIPAWIGLRMSKLFSLIALFELNYHKRGLKMSIISIFFNLSVPEIDPSPSLI